MSRTYEQAPAEGACGVPKSVVAPRKAPGLHYNDCQRITEREHDCSAGCGRKIKREASRSTLTLRTIRDLRPSVELSLDVKAITGAPIVSILGSRVTNSSVSPLYENAHITSSPVNTPRSPC